MKVFFSFLETFKDILMNNFVWILNMMVGFFKHCQYLKKHWRSVYSERTSILQDEFTLKQCQSQVPSMDYVRHGEIQGRSFVFFKAHCPCILPCLT